MRFPTIGFGFGPGGRGAGVFLGVIRILTMYRPSPPRTRSTMSMVLGMLAVMRGLSKVSEGDKEKIQAT